MRDRSGTLVISHDMPDGREITLSALIDLLAARDLPLAMNIKADGLARPLQARLQAAGLSQWFTFDMSVPEMIVQLRLGLPVFTRASEFEQPPACYNNAIGVWLDAFEGLWYTPQVIESFLRDGKRVCIVSPELHGRDYGSLWSLLRSSHLSSAPDLMLCTDLPEQAIDYFRSA
ncbi:MAG TPA: hypothetical protein VM782_23395 [Stellaceae bacterium]|nr:hypothetical protein [Stellaceae bacterium]